MQPTKRPLRLAKQQNIEIHVRKLKLKYLDRIHSTEIDNV